VTQDISAPQDYVKAWQTHRLIALVHSAFERFPLGFIVALGFGLRCFYCLHYKVINSPDAIVYLAEAGNLFSTGGMQSDTYMPLYPILLHLAGLHGIIILQIVLSTASIYLGYRIAADIWSRRDVALTAALAFALHPMLAYYVSFRLTETVFIFFLLLGFAALYRNRILCAALAFVLADLMRPSLDLLFPAIIVAGAFATIVRPSLREIARRLAVFALVYGALMSPWWVHQYKKYHQFVRLDLAGGTIMLLENNELFERVGLDWSKLTFWTPFAGIADPVERDEAMRAAAISYIQTHPLTWLRADIDRARRFFTPNDVSYNMLQETASAVLLVVTMAGMALVLWSRSRWRQCLPLWLPIVFLTSLHLSFHGLPRYRLPLDPLMIIIASGALIQLRAPAHPPVSVASAV
jgi:hypothetical protein